MFYFYPLKKVTIKVVAAAGNLPALDHTASQQSLGGRL